jgi:glucan 1,3-beta-glucosidase
MSLLWLKNCLWKSLREFYIRIGQVFTRSMAILIWAHIRLADFQAIASAGVNTVRIPVGNLHLILFWDIGYWSFVLVPGDPYIQGFAQYLDQGITWAQQCGLKVWIDLHGAPGSLQFFLDWQKGLKMDSITLAEEVQFSGEQAERSIIPSRHFKQLWANTLLLPMRAL